MEACTSSSGHGEQKLQERNSGEISLAGARIRGLTTTSTRKGSSGSEDGVLRSLVIEFYLEGFARESHEGSERYLSVSMDWREGFRSRRSRGA